MLKPNLAGIVSFIIGLFLLKSLPAQYITTVAGNGISACYENDNLAICTPFSYPSGVCVATNGDLYITCGNSLKKLTRSTGIVTSVAGSDTPGNTGDGGPAVNALMQYAKAVRLDGAGNIYVAEYSGSRIRKITVATGIITTIAGRGSAGYSGDGGPAVNAEINHPWDISLDAAGNVFIADFSNSCIRKVDAVTGIITTIAGNGTTVHSGDGGPAINAGIPYPNSLSHDKNGNLYISESLGNITCRIRKIDIVTGIINTIAGNNSYLHSGDGGLAINASLFDPSGVLVDPSGNVYISQYDDSRIRKIDAVTGIINTIAGTGTNGFSGDGGPAKNAMLYYPIGLSMDASGDLFVCDNSNLRVRKIFMNATSPPVTDPAISISSSSTIACGNEPVTFTATTSNPGLSPIYQWRKNGVATGANYPAYTDSGFAAGDIISCTLTSSLCVTSPTVASNNITLTGGTAGPLSVSIAASSNTICTGENVAFTATPVNGGASPLYQWKLNGNNAGTNSPGYANSALVNGDIVSCAITADPALPCAPVTPAVSGNIVMTVNATPAPSVSIAASENNICTGTMVTFSATAHNAGNSPLYQWKLNGNNVGTNNPLFTSATLVNGDIINCLVTVDPALPCATGLPAFSANIVMTVNAALAASVSIAAPGNNVCPGNPVSFSATTQNSGTLPSYQWKLNGKNVGGNNAVYTNNNPVNNDQVTCEIIPNGNCSLNPVSSNIITLAVKNLPAISLSPLDTVVAKGSQVQLNATINGAVAGYSWSPLTGLNNSSGLTALTVPIQDETAYLFSILTSDNCTASLTTVIKIQQKLFMPNAFTPNNDGLNDLFRIPPNVSLILKEFTIYDRWGNKIFATPDVLKGWDGYAGNQKKDAGIYIYIIKGFEEGKAVFLKGYFTLVR